MRIPLVKPDRTSIWAQYSVLSDRREELIRHLNSKNIPTAIYYPKPLHLQEAFGFLGYHQGDFPISEQVANQIFSLPIHPYFSEQDQSFIIEVLKED